MRTEWQSRPRERHWTCACRLRERRVALGLTQVEVADALRREGLDLGNRALSAMEHGHALDLGWLPELATALDCTTTYLLGMTADPHEWTPDPVHTRARASGSADTARSAAARTSTETEHLSQSTRRGWILGPDVPDRHAATRSGSTGSGSTESGNTGSETLG
jgi:transcriptional regulator with XRE-family HTH domain